VNEALFRKLKPQRLVDTSVSPIVIEKLKTESDKSPLPPPPSVLQTSPLPSPIATPVSLPPLSSIAHHNPLPSLAPSLISSPPPSVALQSPRPPPSEKDQSKIDSLKALASKIEELSLHGDITFKELAMVFGDHFIGKSSFEGKEVAGDISSTKYIILLIDFLEKRMPLPVDLDNVLKKLRANIDLKQCTGSSAVNDLAKSIKEKTAIPGSSCLLSGGWIGHAVMFEIERGKDGTYSFRVYNRGSGSEFHHQYLVSGTEKVAPCLALCKISDENMLNPLFVSCWIVVS
jgi:hypothetical protein